MKLNVEFYLLLRAFTDWECKVEELLETCNCASSLIDGELKGFKNILWWWFGSGKRIE